MLAINDYSKMNPFPTTVFIVLVTSIMALQGCGGGGGNSSNGGDASISDDGALEERGEGVDITNAIFTHSSRDCADYNNVYEASVLDIQRSLGFDADVSISNDDSSCTLASNGIPNHDFNDVTPALPLILLH